MGPAAVPMAMSGPLYQMPTVPPEQSSPCSRTLQWTNPRSRPWRILQRASPPFVAWDKWASSAAVWTRWTSLVAVQAMRASLASALGPSVQASSRHSGPVLAAVNCPALFHPSLLPSSHPALPEQSLEQ
ncbi:hypothetical protein GJAV_G00016250 [Gymnothorax javanicus]|nr:hypothetical protein GJAV_G00016250 [Gymnothorax javanicus]